MKILLDTISICGKPVERPTQSAWDNFARILGTELPDDYKEFVSTLGTGVIDDFLWIFNPASTNPHLNLFTQRDECLSALRVVSDHGEPIPYGTFPENGGLLPFGATDNGDVLYWITRGRPADWKVVVNESRGPAWVEYSMGFSRLLGDLLRGHIQCPIFPHDFPRTRIFKPAIQQNRLPKNEA
ncbi:MAG: SMI1/KNR4 family protein [Xanthomonadales bacterium]|nr:SMI1/KNR4 family protein [Xanthomonadales bacterium]MCB1642381.1 SMI1/KNR4 family protein [Xanthomonadales bacterium]